MALVYTSQPGGALSDKPIQVIYPNLLGTDPGTVVELWACNHDTVQWYIYGYGTVSQDGKVITPNINPNTNEPYGLTDFSWHAPNAGQNGNPGDGKHRCPKAETPKPVDLTTGIKIENVTDIAFGGSRGGISLTRTYTSDNAGQAVIGRFSRGWKDNYEISLDGNWVVGGAGRVIQPEEQTGRLFSYARTESGNLIFERRNSSNNLADSLTKFTDGTFTYRYGDGEKMNFDSFGRLTEMTDRNGNTTTLTYSGGSLTTITDAVGRSIQYTYDSNNRVIKVTDPLNRDWLYTYTNTIAYGALDSVTDPAGNTMRYEYQNLRISKIIDPRGNLVKQITHDANGRVIRQEFADGGFETYEYTTSGAIVTETKITDPLGRVMIKRFNANGYVIEQTDGTGQRAIIDRNLNNSLSNSTRGSCGCTEESRKFDERGNKTETTDQLGNVAKTFYEPTHNNVTKTTDKLGRETNFAYDTNGNLTNVTDVLGRTSGASYDNFGRLIGTTDALSQTESFEYDANGFITARVDKLGKRWTMIYDLIGRMISQSDPLNRTSSYTYDSLDRVVTITDAAGAVTTFTYDENSNRTKVTDHLGRIWRSFYDTKNRLVKTVDPIGRISRRTYNIGDETTKVTSPSLREMRYEYDQRGQAVKIFDGLNNASNYTYDYERKLQTVQDKRGNTTSFEYDELDRPILQRNPLGQTSSAKYDSLGKVTESTDEIGRRTNFTYDAVNRMTNIAYADAQVGYTYDTLNRITQISDTQGGTLNWGYDALGQVQSETTANGIVSYTYNDARQRISMTALNRPSVNYGYDSAGRLANITQGSDTFGYNYDSISRMTLLTRPNGVNTNYEYDQVNRLKRMTHGTIEDFKYEYNSDDEIASIESVNSATQLPTAKNSSGANSANRITQFGDSTFSFDNKGQTTTNTTASGTSMYTWDIRGRLKTVAMPNGETVNYGYDALGRRTSNNQTTNFVYDGQDVVQDKQGSNNVNYLNGLGIDDKLKVDNKYFLKDHLGSTIGLTNTSGSLVESQK
jgi:YD repeat-containing protein